MKRNLMNELKEGIDALAEKRETKRRVYLVYYDEDLMDCLFTKEAADEYVEYLKHRNLFDIDFLKIKILEETDDGRSREIF